MTVRNVGIGLREVTIVRAVNGEKSPEGGVVREGLNVELLPGGAVKAVKLRGQAGGEVPRRGRAIGGDRRRGTGGSKREVVIAGGGSTALDEERIGPRKRRGCQTVIAGCGAAVGEETSSVRVGDVFVETRIGFEPIVKERLARSDVECVVACRVGCGDGPGNGCVECQSAEDRRRQVHLEAVIDAGGIGRGRALNGDRIRPRLGEYGLSVIVHVERPVEIVTVIGQVNRVRSARRGAVQERLDVDPLAGSSGERVELRGQARGEMPRRGRPVGQNRRGGRLCPQGEAVITKSRKVVKAANSDGVCP